MGGLNRALIQTNEGDRRVARVGDGNMAFVAVAAIAADANTTLTPAQLLGGVVTSAAKTASRNMILPLATDMAAATVPNMDIGDTFIFKLASIDGQSAVVTTNTGWTVIGNATVLTASAKDVVVTKTGAATFQALVL